MIFPGLEEIEIITDAVEEKESRCLAKGMQRERVIDPLGSTPEEQIVRILEGTKKVRFGAGLTPENFEHAREVVRRYMDICEPIHFVTLWGPVKGYEPGIYETPDVGDLLALRRYALLNETVRSIHEPGINVTIHPEDSGKIARHSHCGKDTIRALRVSMGQYDFEMRELIDVLGADFISWVPESEAFTSIGVTQDQFNRQVEKNFRLFHDYWNASTSIDQVLWEGLPEYSALQEMGWRGVLPKAQRDCYLQRAASHRSLCTTGNETFDACMYVSAAFSRHQLGLIQPKASDEQGPIPVFKATFVPLPKGAPEQLKRGRFDYKPRDTCGHSSETPWSFGGIKTCEGYDAHPFLMSTQQAFSLSQQNGLRQSQAVLYGVNGSRRINCYKAVPF